MKLKMKLKTKNYTQIQNNVLENLVSYRLNGTEYQVILTVIRKTNGFQKNNDWISLSQFEKITGKTKKSICSAINSLVKKSILVKKTTQGIKTEYGLNLELVKKTTLVYKTTLVKKTTPTSVEKVNQLVYKTTHTKESITKETNTKEKRGRYTHPSKSGIDDDYLQELAERNNVPVSFVKSKYEDMVLWYEENPYKNKKISWKATLARWVKSDMLKIRKEQHGKSKIRFISD